jgi:hypothetical protein
MTTQIIHLTEKIQRWLNQSVARNLAAQAERLEPVTKH